MYGYSVRLRLQETAKASFLIATSDAPEVVKDSDRPWPTSAHALSRSPAKTRTPPSRWFWNEAAPYKLQVELLEKVAITEPEIPEDVCYTARV